MEDGGVIGIGLVGARIGARLMVKAKSEMIRVGFGLIMWLFAVQLVLKLLGFI